MLVAKQVADLITLMRAFLAVWLAWVGLSQGLDGLPLAVWVLIAAWTSDAIDGPIARRSRINYHSWVGDHDLAIDMTVSIGVLIYLMATNQLPLLLGVGYLLLWAMVFWHWGVPRSLGMLFQAPVYGWFIWVAVTQSPGVGIWLPVWILGAVVFTWPRFPREVVPDFLRGIRQVILHMDQREH